MAVYSAMLQLVAAVSSLTFVLVTGVRACSGSARRSSSRRPALAALPAGRLMDRFGRVPVLAGGFALRRRRLRADGAGARLAIAPLALIPGFVLARRGRRRPC